MAQNEIDDESTFLLLLGACVVAFGWIPLGAFFEPVRIWLLEHDLLVPAGEALVVIPGWESGLDIARIALLGLVVVFFLVLVIAGVRRRKLRS